LGPLGTAATNWPIVTAPGDYDDGEFGGKIGRGNRSTRRKPAPVPLCPPQTPHVALMLLYSLIGDESHRIGTNDEQSRKKAKVHHGL
jgi:hypothetical protein